MFVACRLPEDFSSIDLAVSRSIATFHCTTSSMSIASWHTSREKLGCKVVLTDFLQFGDSGDDECEQGLKKDEHSDCVLMCAEQNGNTRYYYITDDSCMDSCPSHMTKVGDNNVCQCEEGKEENNGGDTCELICTDSSLKYLDGDECQAECPEDMQPGTNDVCGP